MNAPVEATILLIEDEPNLRNSLSFILAGEGFCVLAASTGEQGVLLAEAHHPDIVLLDIGLPGMDGFDVAQCLAPERQARSMRIVVLTGNDDENDMVRAFEGFADDYIVKPVRPRVLLARLRSLLGRSSTAPQSRQQIRLSELCIDLDAHEARHRDAPLHLTRTEFDILRLLAAHPARVHRRLDLISAVHGALGAVSERSIDFQIHGLRRKLENSGVGIETVRGVGFKLTLG